MRILSRGTLRAFWTRHPGSEQPLKAWFKVTSSARWKTPGDVKACYASASILKNGRAVFNIAGNKYRLVAAINYDYGRVLVKFIGTHAEYDRIDAQTVSLPRSAKQ